MFTTHSMWFLNKCGNRLKKDIVTCLYYYIHCKVHKIPKPENVTKYWQKATFSEKLVLKIKSFSENYLIVVLSLSVLKCKMSTKQQPNCFPDLTYKFQWTISFKMLKLYLQHWIIMIRNRQWFLPIINWQSLRLTCYLSPLPMMYNLLFYATVKHKSVSQNNRYWHRKWFTKMFSN
jgi:hypothetical protein